MISILSNEAYRLEGEHETSRKLLMSDLCSSGPLGTLKANCVLDQEPPPEGDDPDRCKVPKAVGVKRPEPRGKVKQLESHGKHEEDAYDSW